MDNNEEVSAFAAYSSKKLKKKKSDKSLKLNEKSKKKLKKKKRELHDGGLQSVLGKLKDLDRPRVATGEEESEEPPKQQKKMVKHLLKAQIESIFDGTCDSGIGVRNNVPVEKANRAGIVSADGSDPRKGKKKLLNGKNEEFEPPVAHRSQMDPNQKVKKKNLTGLSSSSSSGGISSGGGTNFKIPNLIYGDSVKMGEEMFSWMLRPVELRQFFEDSWERKPLHVRHNNPDYFKCVCTLGDFKRALAEKDIYFSENVDVTSYVDGERHTENPAGAPRATLPVVWDFFNSGKSIRLLNPQTFIPNVRLLNTTLQEFFHCFVGANIYLTPAGTQGFAPHYDDIEAFVLQLEGEKQWKLYNPRSPNEVLPRESSRNFRQDEIGEPIMEVTLKPGDLLYFPRGTIHQANCLPHVHSLHITVSCYQKNSWADLFEKILPVALQTAIAEDVEFRRGLPIGYLGHVGMVYSDRTSAVRQRMVKKFDELTRRIFDFCPLDAGVDQLGGLFMYAAMPPYLTEEEKLHGGDRNSGREDQTFLEALRNHSDKNLGVKLIRATSVRLISEDNELCLYYTTDNSLVYHGAETSVANLPVEWAPAVEHLIHSYPNFVEMKSLPVMRRDEKPGKWRHIAEFVYFLWQRGLVLFDKPHLQIYS